MLILSGPSRCNKTDKTGVNENVSLSILGQNTTEMCCFCCRKKALTLCGWSHDGDSASIPIIDRFVAFPS